MEKQEVLLKYMVKKKKRVNQNSKKQRQNKKISYR